MYGLKKKDEVKLLKETHEKSDSEEPVLKQENMSTMVSCGNWLFPKLSFYNQNKLETKLKCQLSTEATFHVLSYRDLLIIRQDGNPWKLLDGYLMKPLTWWKVTIVFKFQVIGETNSKRLYYPQKPVKSKTSQSKISSWSSSLGWQTSSLVSREYTERLWWMSSKVLDTLVLLADL